MRQLPELCSAANGVEAEWSSGRFPLFSKEVAMGLQIDNKSRQGVTAAMERMVRLGRAEMAQRELQYTAHAKMWWLSIKTAVNDDVWSKLSMSQKQLLSDERSIYVQRKDRGVKVSPWPDVGLPSGLNLDALPKTGGTLGARRDQVRRHTDAPFSMSHPFPYYIHRLTTRTLVCHSH